jgi:CheY-like chemotaxis protein
MNLVNTILLIDDEKKVNLLNHSLLQKLNISNNIFSVQSVEEAIQFIFRRKSPELILLDLDMPVIDGYEFLELFKRMKFEGYANTLIFVLHESAESIDVKRLFNTGITRILIKPLTMDSFKEVIKHFRAMI